jgi:ATP synthase protein I
MPDSPGEQKKFISEVNVRERRKIRARDKKTDEFWFGLGTFGMVGWAVSIPTVLGIFLGVWIDSKWPGPISWTISLLVIGLLLGCLNAWFWLNRQRRIINREREDDTA